MAYGFKSDTVAIKANAVGGKKKKKTKKKAKKGAMAGMMMERFNKGGY